MAGRLSDEFLEHDTAGLAALTPDGRARQEAAREQLLEYVETMWEDAKARGLNPAVLPEWSAVAGMSDLARFLYHNASEATANDHDRA